MRTRHLLTAAAATTAVLAAWPAAAHAKAIDKTGQAVIVAAPANLAPGSFEDDTAVRIMDERSNTLAGPLGIWNVDANGTLTASSRGKDECVESHLMHADHVGTASTASLAGSVTFTQPVLGVEPINNPASATLASALDSTDGLFGVQGTTYPSGLGTPRGAEPTAGDRLVLTGPNTIQFNFGNDDFDEVRVITKCEVGAVVPEVPATLLLSVSAAAMLGAVVVVGRHRRRLAV